MPKIKRLRRTRRNVRSKMSYETVWYPSAIAVIRLAMRIHIAIRLRHAAQRPIMATFLHVSSCLDTAGHMELRKLTLPHLSVKGVRDDFGNTSTFDSASK